MLVEICDNFSPRDCKLRMEGQEEFSNRKSSLVSHWWLEHILRDTALLCLVVIWKGFYLPDSALAMFYREQAEEHAGWSDFIWNTFMAAEVELEAVIQCLLGITSLLFPHFFYSSILFPHQILPIFRTILFYLIALSFPRINHSSKIPLSR